MKLITSEAECWASGNNQISKQSKDRPVEHGGHREALGLALSPADFFNAATYSFSFCLNTSQTSSALQVARPRRDLSSEARGMRVYEKIAAE